MPDTPRPPKGELLERFPKSTSSIYDFEAQNSFDSTKDKEGGKPHKENEESVRIHHSSTFWNKSDESLVKTDRLTVRQKKHGDKISPRPERDIDRIRKEFHITNSFKKCMVWATHLRKFHVLSQMHVLFLVVLCLLQFIIFLIFKSAFSLTMSWALLMALNVIYLILKGQTRDLVHYYCVLVDNEDRHHGIEMTRGGPLYYYPEKFYQNIAIDGRPVSTATALHNSKLDADDCLKVCIPTDAEGRGYNPSYLCSPRTPLDAKRLSKVVESYFTNTYHLRDHNCQTFCNDLMAEFGATNSCDRLIEKAFDEIQTRDLHYISFSHRRPVPVLYNSCILFACIRFALHLLLLFCLSLLDINSFINVSDDVHKWRDEMFIYSVLLLWAVGVFILQVGAYCLNYIGVGEFTTGEQRIANVIEAWRDVQEFKSEVLNAPAILPLESFTNCEPGDSLRVLKQFHCNNSLFTPEMILHVIGVDEGGIEVLKLPTVLYGEETVKLTKQCLCDVQLQSRELPSRSSTVRYTTPPGKINSRSDDLLPPVNPSLSARTASSSGGSYSTKFSFENQKKHAQEFRDSIFWVPRSRHNEIDRFAYVALGKKDKVVFYCLGVFIVLVGWTALCTLPLIIPILLLPLSWNLSIPIYLVYLFIHGSVVVLTIWNRFQKSEDENEPKLKSPGMVYQSSADSMEEFELSPVPSEKKVKRLPESLPILPVVGNAAVE